VVSSPSPTAAGELRGEQSGDHRDDPPVIVANAVGSVVNANSVPSVGSNPNVKPTAKMTRPAQSAAAISGTAINSDARRRSVPPSR